MCRHRWAARLPVLACALAALIPSAAAAAPSTTRNASFWVPNRQVFAIAADSGRVYIGGDFTAVGPLTGTLTTLDATSGVRDPGFPLVNGPVEASIQDGSGGWYVAGGFDRVGGQPRLDLAHVLADGSVDPSFAAEPDNDVTSLALDGTDLFVGGSFTHVGAAARNHLAKLNATTGAVDGTWDPAESGGADAVRALAVSAAGLYVAGSYTTIGGASRTDLALLSKTGSGAADNTFISNVTTSSDGPKALLLANGKLYVGGFFTAIHGTARQNLAAVSPTDGTDQGLDADADSGVAALAASGTKLFVGGFFSKLTHSGSDTARAGLAAVDASSGAVDAGWSADADDGVNQLALGGGSLYVAGRFTHIGASARNFLAKVAVSDGSLDPIWNPLASDEVDALNVAGSRVLVGGFFNSVNGVVRNRLAALDLTTGTAVGGFAPVVDDRVLSLALLGSKLYLGGGFATVNGDTRNHIAAVDPGNGGLDPSFQPDFGAGGGDVFALAGSGTTLYVGGRFTTLNGVASPGLAAVGASNGTPVWRGDVESNGVRALALAAGRLYLGGEFDHIDGTPWEGFGAVSPATGALDPSAGISAHGFVNDLSPFGSRLYAAGFFDQFGGVAREDLAAIDTGTNALLAWTTSTPVFGVNSVRASISGIYVGGSMELIGGKDVHGLALLDPDTGAPDAWLPDLANGSGLETVAIGGGKLFAGGDTETNDFVETHLAVYDFHPPVNTAPPVAALAGATLSCSTGSWDGRVLFGYEWLRDGSPMAGATSVALQTSPGDAGHSFACRVSATSEGGSTAATSAAVALPAPQAKDSKKPKVGLSRIKRSGRLLKLTLRCPADEQFCQGTVTASAVTTAAASRKKKTRKVKLGSVRFKVSGGKKKALKIKLSRKAVGIIKAKHRVTLTVKTRDAAGNRATLAKKVRLA